MGQNKNKKIPKTETDPMTLEDLLRDCSAEKFSLTNEDREWVHAKSRGLEI